jgi:alpha-glucosidase
MGYSFELLGDDFSAGHIRRTVEALEANLSDGWPCWAISNHDVERVLTRWGGAAPSTQLAKLLTALVASLRGSVCIYQGEELGLPEAVLKFDQLRDPYGIAFWPNFKGRDGCRTPMPWRDDDGAGFSAAKPWLPIPDAHRARAVSRQDAASDSVLNGFRAFMAWRKQIPALRLGDIRFLDVAEPLLAFTRSDAGATVLAVFNLGTAAARMPLPPGAVFKALACPGASNGTLDGASVELPGHSLFYATADA